jgi:hypothetical protein
VQILAVPKSTNLVRLSHVDIWPEQSISLTKNTLGQLTNLFRQASNPFVFKHVQHLTGSLDDSGPCVVMATPSMLQVPVSSSPQAGPSAACSAGCADA